MTGPKGLPDLNRRALVLVLVIVLAAVGLTAAVKLPPRIVGSASPLSEGTVRIKKMVGMRYTLPKSLIFYRQDGTEAWLPAPPEISPGRAPAVFNSGDRSRKRAALTFDSDVIGANGLAVIDTLYKLQVPSTFFVTGEWAKANPDLLKAASQRGFEIASHSLGHPNFTTIDADETARQLRETATIVEGITGQPIVAYFRPPYGAYNQQTVDVCANQGYAVVLWDCDSSDWAVANQPALVVSRATANVRDGSIVLLHFDGPLTPEVLPRIVENLRAGGFDLTTVTGVISP